MRRPFVRPSPLPGAFLVATALLAGAACQPGAAGRPPAAPPVAAPHPAAAAAPGPATRPALAIDESFLDRAADPCVDFFQYACGAWLERTPIPADRSSWTRFDELSDRNLLTLRGILERLAAGDKVSDDPYLDRVGAFYATCMDEAAIEETAPAELAARLRRVDAVKNVGDLARALAEEHLGLGAAYNRWFGAPLFMVLSEQDYKDATRMIARIDQAGLGLPDRDYYLERDATAKRLRDDYRRHVARMLTLAGLPSRDAARQARAVLRIERALAEASMSRADRRDPDKTYHLMDRAELRRLAPRFPWADYWKALGHRDVGAVNVANPAFFRAVNGLLEKVPVTDWRAYLRWHLVHAAAPLSSRALVDEDFAFYGKVLNGIDELEPRWRRCVTITDEWLGEALGRPYVRLTFGEEGRAATRELIGHVQRAMGATIETVDWMTPAARRVARRKLDAIVNKIGYPDEWRRYDALEIGRTSHVTNVTRAIQFDTQRRLAQIGRPVERGEWFMSPPTVNAYYNFNLNEIVFPAGILQPPFFHRDGPLAVSYGAIGMVMGHEITHGFDDEGRRFDARGNLREWWPREMSKEFERRAECVVEQFDGYVALDDLRVNGRLTLGENIADLGGLKIAHAAYRAARGGDTPRRINAWSDEQLFFLGFAQAWCGKRRPENVRVRLATDPHAPPRFRVNGPLSNLPAFAEAFECRPGEPMVRAKRCEVW